MSVLISDSVYYGSVNMPEADGATVGGAIDFTRRVAFNDITPSGLLDYVSSSASDTATKINVSGRDSTGVIQTETKTLNGTTVVAGAQSFERLLYGASSGASATGPLANPGGTAAVGDIAAISHTAVVSAHTMRTGSAQATSSVPALAYLATGDGASVSVGQIIRTTGGTGPNQLRQIVAINPGGLGADVVAINRNWTVLADNTTTYNIHQGFLFEILPNPVTSIVRPFSGAAADVSGGSSRAYVEKIFCVNNNTTTALTLASIIKQVDPAGSGVLQIALTNVLNDMGTVANRQTAVGSGITAYTSGAAPQTINVPSPQNLPSGSAPNSAGAQGIWLQLTLAAGIAAQKTSFTLRDSGTTT